MADVISFSEPDEVLTAKPSVKKYLRYLLFFGPGAVLASMTIGQGQIILGPQIGAWAGFSLLWLVTINIGSYIIAYVSCRFIMLSGISTMDMFSIKTKKGWLNWLFIVIMLIFIPMFAAAIITTLGQSLAWVFGVGHYLVWGISFCLLAASLALLGRYRLLEYTQAFFVAVLAIGAVASIVWIKPDILEILPNFFTIGMHIPENYPAWASANYPSVTKTPISLVMLGYLGTLTVTIIPLAGYMGWIKVKKWGIFRGRENPDGFSQKLFRMFREKGEITYLPDDVAEVKKSHILLKPILVDLAIAFVIVSLVSASYLIAGKYLLGDSHVLPSDTKLIQEQLVIFTRMADWLKPLFQVSVIFALFGTVYAGFEAASRMSYETAKKISRHMERLPYKKFMLYLMIYILSLGIPLAILMCWGLSVILVLSLTLMFIGVIGVIIYGIGIIYLSQKVLPEKYKLGKVGLAIAILGVAFMLVPLVFLFV